MNKGLDDVGRRVCRHTIGGRQVSGFAFGEPGPQVASRIGGASPPIRGAVLNTLKSRR
jgi:hypothetical protein